MIQADVAWCWNHHYLYSLETGEALLYSSPAYDGDGTYHYFSDIFAARAYVPLASDSIIRSKGSVTFDEDFINLLRKKKIHRPNKDSVYHSEGYYGQEAYQNKLQLQMEKELMLLSRL